MEIAAGGHAVVVDAPEPLTTVADTALRLWTATDSPALVRGFGFTGDGGSPVWIDTPYEVAPPLRMTEGPDEQ